MAEKAEAAPINSGPENVATPEKPLLGIRILIVEDEWIVAYDLASTLTAAGAVVIGPATTLAKAKQLAGIESDLHAALLDYQLGRDDVLPVARILADRKIPFVFHTGHASSSDLSDWPDVAILAKPAMGTALVQALCNVIAR